MWMYNSDHGDSDNFGAESETSYTYLVTAVIMSQLSRHYKSNCLH